MIRVATEKLRYAALFFNEHDRFGIASTLTKSIRLALLICSLILFNFGRDTINVRPRLTVLYTEMLPPCASMKASAIVRPGVCSGRYIAVFALYFLIGALYYGNASLGMVCD